MTDPQFVIPANAGNVSVQRTIQRDNRSRSTFWIPPFAGMTTEFPG